MTEEEITANQPVETGESDTGNRSEPGMEEEQEEPERSGEEAPIQQEQAKEDEPEQQPIQPEIGREIGTEQQSGREPLDAFKQSLLDILDEEWGSVWVRSARHFPTGVPYVGRSEEEGQVGSRNRI